MACGDPVNCPLCLKRKPDCVCPTESYWKEIRNLRRALKNIAAQVNRPPTTVRMIGVPRYREER